MKEVRSSVADNQSTFAARGAPPAKRASRALLAALAACAGTVRAFTGIVGALGGVAGVVVQAEAQQARSVYPDDSVVARGALIQVRELHASGNTGEALRVVQGILESDAEKLVPTREDPDVFVNVRKQMHELLISIPELLTRYRSDMEPLAATALAAGETARVERVFFLTSSGFEATLRKAQLELESGRFESARLVLQQLEGHPDRQRATGGGGGVAGGSGGKEAAAMARLVQRYLPREDVIAWAKRWSTEAGILDAGDDEANKQVTWPKAALMRGRTPLETSPAPELSAMTPTPLRSVLVSSGGGGGVEGSGGGGSSAGRGRRDGAPIFVEEDLFDDSALPQSLRRRAMTWMLPTVYEGVVYATDGLDIGAWDAATLSPIWHTRPSGTSFGQAFRNDEPMQIGMSGARNDYEDAAMVTVSGGVAITAGGIPFNGSRSGDSRLYAFDAQTGAPMWKLDPATLDQGFLGPREGNNVPTIRGPVVVEGDTAVITLRKSGSMRRITSVYLVGVDLFTGTPRWSRLLGSYGTNPWGRNVSRPEGMTVHQGVVYRSDDMGITGAYEVGTGRPVWVRLSPTRASFDYSMRNEEAPSPYAMHKPVIWNDSLFIIEPILANNVGRVIQISTQTGALIAARDGSALGGPSYLFTTGEYLGAVSDARVAFVKLDEFGMGSVRLSQSYGNPWVMGRAVATADGKALLPLSTAIVTLDPVQPEAQKVHAIATPGNLGVFSVNAEAKELGEHLLILDGVSLHTFLPWEQAQALLEMRMAQSPKDASPILTYIDLVRKGRKTELLAPLTDRALVTIEKTQDIEKALQDRDVLFRMLRDTVEVSRRKWFDVTTTGEATEEEQGQERQESARRTATTPLKDLGQLDALVDRLERAAEGSEQLVTALLEKAWVRATQKRYADAVECYQQILLSPELSRVSLANDIREAKLDAALPAAAVTASARARERLVALLKEFGSGPYAAFDEEAGRALEGIASADALALETLARRYPVARVTPEIWRQAARAFLGSRELSKAKHALGAGLAAAELSASIGRENQQETIASLAGELAHQANAANDAEPLYRLLRRLHEDYPGMKINGPLGSTSPRELADTLMVTLAKRTDPARIGTRLSASGVQALAGWEPIMPLSRHVPGHSMGTVVMVNDSLKQVALWGTNMEDGELVPIWMRSAQTRPSVVRVSPQQTLLFWPSSTGGYLEAINNVGSKIQVGSVAWKTSEFSSLFAALATDSAPGIERFGTPTDGQVRPEDVLILVDPSRAYVLQRRGRLAAFDLQSGALAWSKALDIGRVFEAEIAGDMVMVAGTYLNKSDGRYMPLVTSHASADGADGPKLTATQLGDHPRWLRGLENGEVLVGSAQGLLRFEPQSGVLSWNVSSDLGRTSVGAWIVGKSAFVLTNEASLVRVNLADGKAQAQEVDTRGALTFPLTAQVYKNTLTVMADRRFMVITEDGQLAGTDALEGQPRVETPMMGAGVIVAIESELQLGGIGGGSGESEGALSSLRFFTFEHPSGRLLSSQRVRSYDLLRGSALMDGKVILLTGPVTMVISCEE